MCETAGCYNEPNMFGVIYHWERCKYNTGYSKYNTIPDFLWLILLLQLYIQALHGGQHATVSVYDQFYKYLTHRVVLSLSLMAVFVQW